MYPTTDLELDQVRSSIRRSVELVFDIRQISGRLVVALLSEVPKGIVSTVCRRIWWFSKMLLKMKFFTSCRAVWESEPLPRTTMIPLIQRQLAKAGYRRRRLGRREPHDSRETDGETSGRADSSSRLDFRLPVSVPTELTTPAVHVPRRVKDRVRKAVRDLPQFRGPRMSAALARKEAKEEKEVLKEWNKHFALLRKGKDDEKPAVLVGSTEMWHHLCQVAKSSGGFVLVAQGRRGGVPHLVLPSSSNQGGVTVSGSCPHGRPVNAVTKESGDRFRRTAPDVRIVNLDLIRRSSDCAACKASGLRTGEKWERLKDGKLKGT